MGPSGFLGADVLLWSAQESGDGPTPLRIIEKPAPGVAMTRRPRSCRYLAISCFFVIGWRAGGRNGCRTSQLLVRRRRRRCDGAPGLERADGGGLLEALERRRRGLGQLVVQVRVRRSHPNISYVETSGDRDNKAFDSNTTYRSYPHYSGAGWDANRPSFPAPWIRLARLGQVGRWMGAPLPTVSVLARRNANKEALTPAHPTAARTNWPA